MPLIVFFASIPIIVTQTFKLNVYGASTLLELSVDKCKVGYVVLDLDT